jgi:hypothetical protein
VARTLQGFGNEGHAMCSSNEYLSGLSGCGGLLGFDHIEFPAPVCLHVLFAILDFMP